MLKEQTLLEDLSDQELAKDIKNYPEAEIQKR